MSTACVLRSLCCCSDKPELHSCCHLLLLPLTQEMNDHDETCRFIQVWLTPDSKAPGYGSPKYGSSCYTKADRHNQLLHMLSGTGPSPAWPAVNSSKDPIQLYQDGNVFVSESDAGSAYELQLAARRQAYILCMEGAAPGVCCACTLAWL